jgi:hypothetical protein
MVSKSTLQQAAEQNIIHQDQVDALYRFLNSEKPEAVNDGAEEPLKFIRSFGDVFISLGIVLLVLAITRLGFSGYYFLIPAGGFILLSEWLVRVRKLALPGIAILLSILYFVHRAIAFDHEQAITYELAALSLISLLYYLRYRMPFSLLPLTSGIIAIVIIQIGLDILEQPIIFFVLGILVFGIAMVFDALDTKRVSQLSDSGFWLHLVAAPLIVHGAMVSMLLSDQSWIQQTNKEMLMVVFFAVFFLMALLVDRRALLVSTQLYAIYALTQLLQNQLSTSQNIVLYVMLGLGLFVIFFGTYWYLARRLVWGFLSGTAISRYIPDLNIRDTR